MIDISPFQAVLASLALLLTTAATVGVRIEKTYRDLPGGGGYAPYCESPHAPDTWACEMPELGQPLVSSITNLKLPHRDIQLWSTPLVVSPERLKRIMAAAEKNAHTKTVRFSNGWMISYDDRETTLEQVIAGHREHINGR